MIKIKYIKILIVALLTGLLTITVLQGCAAEDKDAGEDFVSQTEEPAQEEDSTGGTETGLAEQDAEEDPAEEAAEEEAIQPAQVMEISPAEVFKIMEDDEDYFIVDVRTQEEYDSGHLEGAYLLPVQELEDRMDEIPMDIPIIVYCRSGSRSRNAAETLVENGYTMVYDMGGIISWEAEGYPVVVEEE